MRNALASIAVAAALAIPQTSFAQGLEFGSNTGGDFSKMTEEQRASFRNEVRAYLLENPDVIFEAIQILEQRRALAGAEADRQLVVDNADQIFADGHSWEGGNPDGDVTVVEFLDYRCGFCKRAHPEVAEMLDRDPNIKLIVKEFPILGPESVRAGKMALAALNIDPEKYADLSDELMAYRGNLTEQSAYQIAGGLGYNIAELKERANSTEIDDQLNENYQLAQALGLQGTPAFIVGTEIIRGYLPVDEMLGAVEEARALAQN